MEFSAAPPMAAAAAPYLSPPDAVIDAEIVAGDFARRQIIWHRSGLRSGSFEFLLSPMPTAEMMPNMITPTTAQTKFFELILCRKRGRSNEPARRAGDQNTYPRKARKFLGHLRLS
jgi:hypothetical protein